MAKDRRSLNGKVVAITGGARGIGRTTAEALVRKGCRVALGDLDLAPAEQAAAELGGGTVAIGLNVTERDSFTAFLDEAERQLGPIDVLVNNAGIMPVTPFERETDDSIRRQLDINVYGVLVGTQLAMRRMRPRGTGHIVNIASSAGKAGVPGIATYSAAKHAVVGLSESVRAELHGSGVGVSCVMPITVDTQLTEGLADHRGVKQVGVGDVAEEIVDALEVNRFDVFVPRSLKATIVGGNLLPRRAREAMARFMGVTKVMTEVDPSRRAAYEERISHNDPGVEPESGEKQAERDAEGQKAA